MEIPIKIIIPVIRMLFKYYSSIVYVPCWSNIKSLRSGKMRRTSAVPRTSLSPCGVENLDLGDPVQIVISCGSDHRGLPWKAVCVT